MTLSLPPLATTHVGSMPRPRWMGETDRSRVSFSLEGEALREAQDDATIVALREQEALGIDIVTDGEQRREGFIFHMCRTWDGIDLVNQVEKSVYRRRNSPRMVPRVTGKLKRRAAATVDDVTFARPTPAGGEDGAGWADDRDSTARSTGLRRRGRDGDGHRRGGECRTHRSTVSRQTCCSSMSQR
jgi:hypothetical protein